MCAIIFFILNKHKYSPFLKCQYSAGQVFWPCTTLFSIANIKFPSNSNSYSWWGMFSKLLRVKTIWDPLSKWYFFQPKFILCISSQFGLENIVLEDASHKENKELKNSLQTYIWKWIGEWKLIFLVKFVEIIFVEIFSARSFSGFSN